MGGLECTFAFVSVWRKKILTNASVCRNRHLTYSDLIKWMQIPLSATLHRNCLEENDRRIMERLNPICTTKNGYGVWNVTGVQVKKHRRVHCAVWQKEMARQQKTTLHAPHYTPPILLASYFRFGSVLGKCWKNIPPRSRLLVPVLDKQAGAINL